MVRSIRTPLLFSFTVVLAGGASTPVLAQRTETVVARRAPRAAASDTNERELRRLGRQADSLAQLYNESDELTAAQRRAVGEALDRTVGQMEELTRRMAEAGSRMVRVRVQVAPMMDERDATAMGDALRQAEASQPVMPRGWMGTLISGTAREPRIENGELIIHYLTHPVILSVDPSSPAEKAGLLPGDTLMAYDGRDVRDRDIAITRLVRPNARVVVSVRREGRTRNVPVIIADVPSRIRLRTESTLEMAAPRATIATRPELPAFPRSPLPPMPALAPRIVLAPSGAADPMSVMTVLPPVAPTSGMILSYGFSTVAGAQLTPVTDGLARTIGIARGVLVTAAGPSSPAYKSGLRDGDVIVRVAGEPVRTVDELRERVQIAADNGESGVTLNLLRERKPLRITLRWR
jgi:membrane-associated protease RseP (regulator of RpoE activity)